jgi:outer membrane receptor protein involved in Fe transport
MAMCHPERSEGPPACLRRGFVAVCAARNDTLLAALFLLIALPSSAQTLFPRLSITGGTYFGKFATDVRADSGTLQGTQVNAERDLGLTASKKLPRFTLEWRPFEHHQLEASYFSASRNGFRSINTPIVSTDGFIPPRPR